ALMAPCIISKSSVKTVSLPVSVSPAVLLPCIFQSPVLSSRPGNSPPNSGPPPQGCSEPAQDYAATHRSRKTPILPVLPGKREFPCGTAAASTPPGPTAGSAVPQRPETPLPPNQPSPSPHNSICHARALGSTDFILQHFLLKR